MRVASVMRLMLHRNSVKLAECARLASLDWTRLKQACTSALSAIIEVEFAGLTWPFTEKVCEVR